MKKNSLNRIFLYRSCLNRLRLMGVERVFSYTLATETGVTPAQVRKDFSEFNIKGTRKGGYEIDDLLGKMEKIFFGNKDHSIILVGMGNMGQALSKYSKFVTRNINIIATFDIDPFKLKQKADIPAYPMDKLQEIISKNKVRIAIITVPEISAQEVTDTLIRNGIKGIVNFAPVLLKSPPDVIISNVNLCDEMERVIYYVHRQLRSDGLKNLELLYRDMKY